MSQYPHRCACGAQCYKGLSSIKCSSSTCPHWDGEDLTKVVNLKPVPSAAIVEKRPMNRLIQVDAAVLEAKKRKSLAEVYGMSGARFDELEAVPDLHPIHPNMPEGLKDSLQRGNAEYASLHRAYHDQTHIQALKGHVPNTRSCSTCKKGFKINHEKDANRGQPSQQCLNCVAEGVDGKCRGCGKRYPSGCAPALCIPCVEKRRAQAWEAMKVYRWAYKGAIKDSPVEDRHPPSDADLRAGGELETALEARKVTERAVSDETIADLQATVAGVREWLIRQIHDMGPAEMCALTREVRE